MTEIRPGDNIQNKINAAPALDTVRFTGGQMPLPEITLAKPLHFTGDAPLIVRGQFYGFKMMPGSSGSTFVGMTIDGTGLAVCDGQVSNVIVDGCTLKGFNNGGSVYGQNSACILHTHAIVNWRIKNSIFKDVDGLAAIYGFHWVNPIVEDCTFSTTTRNGYLDRQSGIKWDGKSGNVTDAIVRRCLFTGIRGMGVEFQTRHIRTLLEDNYYEKPVLGTGPRKIVNGREMGPNDNVFGFSCPWDDSATTGCIIRRNLFDCGDSAASDGAGVRNLIELGGTGTLVEENYFKAGTTYWVGIDITHGTATGTILKTWMGGTPKSGHNIRGATGGFQQIGNSVTKPPLFWDVNRPKPGAGAPVPVPPSPLALRANADGSISASWTAGTGPFNVSAKTSQGADPWKVIGTTPHPACVLVDGHPGWEYTIKVDGVGEGKIRVAGDPNTPGPVNDLKFKSDVPPQPPQPKVVTITDLELLPDGSCRGLWKMVE